MSVFLSEEWLEELGKSISDLPKQKGVDGKVKFVITSSPLGKVQFCLDVSEGQVAKLVAGPDKENDVTATFKYPDAKRRVRHRSCIHEWTVQIRRRLHLFHVPTQTTFFK